MDPSCRNMRSCLEALAFMERRRVTSPAPELQRLPRQPFSRTKGTRGDPVSPDQRRGRAGAAPACREKAMAANAVLSPPSGTGQERQSQAFLRQPFSRADAGPGESEKCKPKETRAGKRAWKASLPLG